MQLIGLSGPARVGKDSIADVLIGTFGFVGFSFSDALYAEVSENWGVPIEELKDAKLKEVPWERLSLDKSKDREFVKVFGPAVHWAGPRSPRWVLQQWGTDYRRKQDPDYWVTRANETLNRIINSEKIRHAQALLDGSDEGFAYIPGIVNTSVRFANEREWIKSVGGTVCHVYRDGTVLADAETAGYVSERGLEPETGDWAFFNNGPLNRLATGVQLLLAGNAIVNTRE